MVEWNVNITKASEDEHPQGKEIPRGDNIKNFWIFLRTSGPYMYKKKTWHKAKLKFTIYR